VLPQRTLKSIVSTVGIGLHSGKRVNLQLRPAAENTGIVFTRTDLSPTVEIKATPENVGETVLSTTLVKDDVKVATIEHLMSALAGLGIDNAYVDLDAPEIPIMDGSAAPFIFLIQSAGIEELDAAKKLVKIKKPVIPWTEFFRVPSIKGLIACFILVETGSQRICKVVS